MTAPPAYPPVRCPACKKIVAERVPGRHHPQAAVADLWDASGDELRVKCRCKRFVRIPPGRPPYLERE